jgi:regulator of sigma E protease
MNILLGIICMFALVGMESAADGYLASNTVAQFEEWSVSDKCDSPIMLGDKIIEVDGVGIHTGNELVYEILNQGYEPIDIVVIRDGERVVLKDVVFPTETASEVTFGNCDFKVARESVTFGSVIKHSVFRSFSSIKIIFDSIKDLIGGRYGAEAVSGPIGMADAVGTATKSGFSSLLYLFILITMNLGVFNLLPFPALDGGRIIFLIIEAIIRRPVKKEVEQAINAAGILLLFGLMIFVTFKDIINLF